MSRNLWTAIATAVGVGGVVGGSLLWSRRASAAPLPGGTPQDEPELGALDLAPLPRAQDVRGDLVTNWGTTPVDLRPLFVQMEEAAKIPGSARFSRRAAAGTGGQRGPLKGPRRLHSAGLRRHRVAGVDRLQRRVMLLHRPPAVPRNRADCSPASYRRAGTFQRDR